MGYGYGAGKAAAYSDDRVLGPNQTAQNYYCKLSKLLGSASHPLLGRSGLCNYSGWKYKIPVGQANTKPGSRRHRERLRTAAMTSNGMMVVWREWT